MPEIVSRFGSDCNAVIAFSALTSAVAAILGLVVSCCAVWVSISAIRSQRKHNKLSVRPLAGITFGDYEDELHVNLRNNGTGPMIILAVSVTDGMKEHGSLIEWMPTLPAHCPWSDFSQNLCRSSISPGSDIVLLQLAEHDGDLDFPECRDRVRQVLASLEIKIEYTDIYDTALAPYTRDLSWFGRNL